MDLLNILYTEIVPLTIFFSVFTPSSVNLSFCLSANGKHLPADLGEPSVFILKDPNTAVPYYLPLCGHKYA